MTEHGWLTSTDPAVMLRHLAEERRNARFGPGPFAGSSATVVMKRQLVSDRKLRLLACACCRQMWHLLTDERSRKAVEVAELYADGLATKDEAEATYKASCHAASQETRGEEISRAAWAVGNATATDRTVISSVQFTVSYLPLRHAEQAHLLRDICGNPFRPVTLHSKGARCEACSGTGDETSDGQGWCGVCNGKGRIPYPWLTPTVVSLAEAAYQERGRKCDRCGGSGQIRNFIARGTGPNDTEYWSEVCPVCANGSGIRGTGRIDDGTLDPVRLSILADALEEAGCDNQDILMHLRGMVKRPKHACHLCGCRVWTPGRRQGGVRMTWCANCKGNGPYESDATQTEWHPYPGGPHVRGCWVIDLLTGKK